MLNTETSRRAAERADDLQRQRDAIAARSSACSHSTTTESEPKAFGGPVAEARAGSVYNPAAHGNIEVTETCSACSATRRALINGCHREVGGWHADTGAIEDQISAARAIAARERRLDAVEAGAWRGDILQVDGAAPVLVQIGTYAGDDRHVALTLDGEFRSYSIDEIAGTASDRRLDDAQRTAWGLIARRARRALAGARS